MITFEQFLQRFCKRARIEKTLSKEELTTYVREKFLTLCEQGIICTTYLKRYKSQFEKIGVLYNKSNYYVKYLPDDKNLCIFIDGNLMRSIGENSIVYCVRGFIRIKDNVKAICRNSTVSCYDNSQVTAYWCNGVYVFNNTEAVVTHCNYVYAENDAKIKLIDYCIACVSDNTTVEARNHCYVQAKRTAKIIASDNIYILAEGGVKIEADKTCSIKRV